MPNLPEITIQIPFEAVLELLNVPIMAYKRHSRRRFSIKIPNKEPDMLLSVGTAYAATDEALRHRNRIRGEMETYFGQFPRIEMYACYPSPRWTLVALELDSSFWVSRVDPALQNRWVNINE